MTGASWPTRCRRTPGAPFLESMERTCRWGVAFVLCWVLSISACSSEGSGAPAEPAGAGSGEPEAVGLAGERVNPPFEVRGNAEGLLLMWFDEEGTHTANARDEIPAARRDQVRVDSLRVAPDDRLDPDFVYLADLTTEGEGGYPVRKVQRRAFDAAVDEATGEGDLPALAEAVIVYGASWCNACRSAASHLRRRGVEFEEKDIERDPSARAEMAAKARSAGIPGRGIPIIDFRGTMLNGYDPTRLDALIDAGNSAVTSTL